jgi:DNA-3-methyladenine glycosylase II
MHSYSTVMTDHPAWVPDETALIRAFPSPEDRHAVARTEGSLLDWCCPEAEAPGPAPETFTMPASAAQAIPELGGALASLGSVARLRNPSLWDALGTAIIRQVVRAAQAQRQHRAFCAAYGDPVRCGTTVAWLFPSPEAVLKLDDDQFADIGLAFKRHAPRSAASAFLIHGNAWERMPAENLAAELRTVPRVGPWTAGAAVADWSNDFSAYPCGDLAVRTWAAHAAPSVTWPDNESVFQQHWQEHAGPHLAELTLLTLAWGGRHARTSAP